MDVDENGLEGQNVMEILSLYGILVIQPRFLTIIDPIL